ncbi:MAG: Flp pilus assembly complex ATPase component TadA [Burkholderiales bacterium]|nr:Flp pilus assembly complex ATPase component TadA [Burkholderiales bacterium]
MPRPEKVRLGEILLQQGLLTAQQLRDALEAHKRSGRRLGRVFVDDGFVSEEQISHALARQLRIPYVDLRHFSVKPDLVGRLPEAQARRFRALVLEDGESFFRVAMADPTDLLAYDEITRILKREIQLAVVTETLLLQTIDRIYRRTEEISGLAHELGQELGDDSIDFVVPSAGTTVEDAPVVRLLQTMFEDATSVRASDIHIEPQEARLVIRFRIDGVLHVQTEVDPRIASALVLRLKLMAGLDISEKRLPQDGRFQIKVRNGRVDVRISTMPVQFGESVVMRLLNQGSGLLSLDRLGMPEHILERVRDTVRRPSGMILVTGPTGSGKTTTLYSALAEINTPERKIITVEDPVEYRLPRINQVQVQEKIELTFARVLRSALRQDPDVILVGEMRDRETVEVGLRAAMTGHVVLSTVHTNDAMSTPMRLVDMGAPRYMMAMSLRLVLAQRLVRKVCDGCAQAHLLQPAEVQWLQQEPDLDGIHPRFLHGKGCAQCNATGYMGRTGVYEMLDMTRAVVQAASDGDPSSFLEAARQQMAGRTLRRHAAMLAARGVTTVEEAMRVSTQADD